MSNDPQSNQHHLQQHFWLWVMCLTGVDYFSTLGYQPSIAFQSTGVLAPLATILLVGVTLFGALPLYRYVAQKSPHGQGSIGMLEHLVSGWTGKIAVISLLGFAATDFVITKTLSAADAVEHMIHNPNWPLATDSLEELGKQRLIATMILLVLLGSMFIRGFREAISAAIGIVGTFLVLNAIVIGRCLYYVFVENPQKLELWWQRLTTGEWHIPDPPLVGHSPWTIVAICIILFPKLALGLSGFETGVAVMPLIRGKSDDDEAEPAGRIRNTRKLLMTAALIMSVYLITSSIVVSTVIDPDQLVLPTGKAKDRALAYIAHGQGEAISPMFGNVFGTIYDASTIAILWFAGASAMAGLLNIIPRYLPRYGMAPEWLRSLPYLVIFLTFVNLLVTWVFDASVSAQGGAYATGVLVIMTSDSITSVIRRWREGSGAWYARMPWYFILITIIFIYTTITVIIEKPAGIQIASCFIGTIFVTSFLSRFLRSTELRFSAFRFKDNESKFLWESLIGMEFPVIVPHRPGGRRLSTKEDIIRREHRLTSDVPIVFVEVQRGDVSDFYFEPIMEVIEEEGRFIIRIAKCASISHVLAVIGLQLSKVGKPPEIHFGWSDESPMAANLNFLFFGEGNVPWMVHELIRKAEPDPERRPRVIIG